MEVDSTSVETSKIDLFNRILEGESGGIFAVGFDEEAIEALVEVLGDLDEPPRVRLLARESVLKGVRSDFVSASAAAELVESENLGLRTSTERLENVLLVTEETVVSVVPAGKYVAGLVVDVAEFVESVHERWSDMWASTEEFRLRTPARSRVEESLVSAFGPDVESDFSAVLSILGTARGSDSGRSSGSNPDEVEVSLLVAAKHEELLYDISKWGKDVGVASKATFSRTKNRLEERGLIETEKVPIDVGRPRQRLVLGDERLHEADGDEFVRVAGSLLLTTSA